MKKGMEDPDPKKKEKEAEKKDRRRKKQKEEDGPKVKLGLDFELEGPKVVRQRPKRGGCTSSGTLGMVGPQLKVKPTIGIEPGDRKKKKETKVLVKRPVREGERIGPDDVEPVEVNSKGRKALSMDEVVGWRAARDLRSGETMNQGMTKG